MKSFTLRPDTVTHYAELHFYFFQVRVYEFDSSKQADYDENLTCKGIESGDRTQCALGILHDENGIEFGMGCALCADD